MTTAQPLHLDFAGELHEVLPGDRFVIGRAGDVEIDDNPYLHRTFLEIVHTDGLWWIANVGSRLPAHLTDTRGVTRTTLSPGARLPIVFDETLLTFTAGDTSYELALSLDRPLVTKAPVPSAEAGDTTITPGPLTIAQKLALLALAERQLRRAGTGASQVPSAVDAAARLGWTQTRFNRKLDNVCDKLERSGVRGLRGEPGAQAANRRARLVEYSVSTLLITPADLPLLEAESRRNRSTQRAAMMEDDA